MDSLDSVEATRVAKIFVVGDRSDTAPVWGYILRHQRLTVILETSLEKALDRWSTELSDKVRNSSI